MPTMQFRRSVALNLKYWLNLTKTVDKPSYHNLTIEQSNIIRAVQFGLILPETQKLAVELFVSVFPLIERRGDWEEWLPIIEPAKEECIKLPLNLQIQFLDCLGQCYRLDRRFDEAISIFKTLEALSCEAMDEKCKALAKLRMGQVYWTMRDYDLCGEYSEAALQKFNTSSDVDPALLGSAYTILGLLRYGQGQHIEAVKKLRQAIRVYREIDQPALLGRSLMNLALSLEASGNKEEALELYRESLLVLSDTEYELDKIRVELSLGTLLLNWGRLDEAEAAFKRADSPYLQRLGLFYYQALAANNLGNTYLEMEKLYEAERFLEKSACLWKKCGGRLMLANTMGTLAEVMLARGCVIRSRDLYQDAVAITSKYPDDAWGRRLNKKFLQALVNLDEGRQKEFVVDHQLAGTGLP